jgi:APA family basic amino acid/polyamine antiporter
VTSATASVIVIYVGIAFVAVAALPVTPGEAPLQGDALNAPVVAIVDVFEPPWLVEVLRYTVAALATLTLVAAANAAMLGLSRLGYSLSRNRQIPSRVGRLHPTRSTPYVLIVAAAILAVGLLVPADLEFLVGIYAFGALLAFLLAHVSICVLRYREPDRPRPYRIPLSVRVRGGDLPLPAVLGAVASALAFASLVVFHEPARYLGIAWMVVGVGLYVVYRVAEDKPVFRRVLVPEEALRHDAPAAEYGSILVPIFGTPLDDDIVQTAGRLAGGERADEAEAETAMIEALWVFEIPMALPIDARLPDHHLKRAREALARAKAVGEDYQGVEVATATVRARRAGEAIVAEARRRGVQAIVLAAEEPSRIRGGGSRLGGKGGPRNDFVGKATQYVVEKAACRVILTAPPAADRPVDTADGRAPGPLASGP